MRQQWKERNYSKRDKGTKFHIVNEKEIHIEEEWLANDTDELREHLFPDRWRGRRL